MPHAWAPPDSKRVSTCTLSATTALRVRPLLRLRLSLSVCLCLSVRVPLCPSVSLYVLSLYVLSLCVCPLICCPVRSVLWAVTCEDFLKAMEDANEMDFTQFRRWYCQKGTPVVTVAHRALPGGKVELTCTQTRWAPARP